VRILIASTPATGRLNPLLAIGRVLIAEGHEVVGLSGTTLRERIESIGAKFRPLPAGADFDLRDIVSVVPELKNIPPVARRDGAPLRRYHPRSTQGVKQVLRDFAAEVMATICFSACCRCCSGRARKGPPLFFVVDHAAKSSNRSTARFGARTRKAHRGIGG
jgi:hypothetical protein